MKVLREAVDLNRFTEDTGTLSLKSGRCCLSGFCCKGC